MMSWTDFDSLFNLFSGKSKKKKNARDKRSTERYNKERNADLANLMAFELDNFDESDLFEIQDRIDELEGRLADNDIDSDIHYDELAEDFFDGHSDFTDDPYDEGYAEDDW